jgi:hypothetical protein
VGGSCIRGAAGGLPRAGCCCGSLPRLPCRTPPLFVIVAIRICEK